MFDHLTKVRILHGSAVGGNGGGRQRNAAMAARREEGQGGDGEGAGSGPRGTGAPVDDVQFHVAAATEVVDDRPVSDVERARCLDQLVGPVPLPEGDRTQRNAVL